MSIESIDSQLYDIYSGMIPTIKSGKMPGLNPEITRLYMDVFRKAIKDGYGKSFDRQKPGTPEFERLARMEANAWYFAASKQKRFLLDLKTAYESMEPDEFDIYLENYHFIQNRSWLQAERDMILANSQMASRWHDMQKVISLPNLKYVTVGDDRVRPEHQSLDGINLPMDHPFWLTHYPPNGFNCRCDVQQNDLKITAENKMPEKLVSIEPVFAFNPGITGQVVGADHPYLKETFGKDSYRKEMMLHCTEAEQPFAFFKLNGNKLLISCFQDFLSMTKKNKRGVKDAFDENFRFAKKVVQSGKNVSVLANHHFNIEGIHSPDLSINNATVDLKTPVTENVEKALLNSIRSGNKQKAQIIIIDLSGFKGVDETLIENKVKGFTNGTHKFVKEVWIYTDEGKVIKHKRLR